VCRKPRTRPAPAFPHLGVCAPACSPASTDCPHRSSARRRVQEMVGMTGVARLLGTRSLLPPNLFLQVLLVADMG
jgi:hypothetical protein